MHRPALPRFYLGSPPRGAYRIHDGIDSGDVDRFEIDVADVERAAMNGAAEALVRFGDEVASSAERVADVFRGVRVGQTSD